MMIELSPEVESLLSERVAAGKYTSIAEAVEHSVSLLVRKEQRDQEIERLRAEVQKGIVDLDAGRYSTLDAVKQRLQARTSFRAAR
mgnify:CR=1 FL=1